MQNIVCFDLTWEALFFYFNYLDLLVDSTYQTCLICQTTEEEIIDDYEIYQKYNYICIDWRYPGYFITIDDLTNERGILHEFCWRTNFNGVTANPFYELLRFALANITIYGPK